MKSINRSNNSRDLSNPNWGPYTKKYMGISHIADKEKGIRFDLSVFPGYYRRRIDVPNVRWETGYHPWEASADLNYYSMRHELEWKDQVYCDISYSKIHDDLRLIKCQFFNHTDEKQNVVLHSMASLNYPTYSDSSNIIPYEVMLPEGCRWIDGLEYTSLEYAVQRHDDHLVYDGLFRGEVRENGFVDAKCLGKGFGREKGDTVTYHIGKNKEQDGYIMFRYMMEKGSKVTLQISGSEEKAVVFEGTGEIITELIEMRLWDTDRIEITSLGGSEIKIDGFAIVSNYHIKNISFVPSKINAIPCMSHNHNNLLLKYDNIEHHYGIRWFYDDYEIREFYCDELDTLMRFKVNDHTSSKLYGKGEGHYTNIFMRPIFLEAQEQVTIYGLVCCGESEDVVEGILNKQYNLTTLVEQNRATISTYTTTDEGEKYLFSQERMAAILLSNVVYPVYVQGEYIRHNTPGRWWDSLYTWDSGFIGIGFCDIDISRAIECLNTYVTDPEDDQRAFIHHGTPLPVQIYLMLEIWNRTNDKELLNHFYPKLKHFYDFIAGNSGLSTTDTFNSSLLQTWDYFYNSGGWDDYPPQYHLFCENKELIKGITPVVTTAHIIRCAKILLMMAEHLEVSQDATQYQQDISKFSAALQRYSWDQEAGYYSYVIHNENGDPTEILKYKNGENFNKGLDGVSPLISGICTNDQKKRLLNHLMSSDELWTAIGISTVDQSANYYTKDGYWNGAVWMPHQWFVWKTMLDIGEGDFAWKIAKTALNLWKDEVENSYHCFEHFIIQSGRGAGWHQFGGLSSPIINWFASYYCVGTLTVGFDIWILDKKVNKDYSHLEATFKMNSHEDEVTCMIIVMNPDANYQVFWNNESLPYKERCKGALEIEVSKNKGKNQLVIQKTL
ncbi:MGH1-like glycoside hydrolase domain-containing protein [Vallitalea okinawensis]|uniref:MGH1-like glycoside hydrolase domain-containing protein n=1 Tax=Vallitalea okinawensis TaxID=2078660 RepID=UPI001A9A39DA|nr:trehalase family glycosidase [Vallitalea okinawensis]